LVAVALGLAACTALSACGGGDTQHAAATQTVGSPISAIPTVTAPTATQAPGTSKKVPLDGGTKSKGSAGTQQEVSTKAACPQGLSHARCEELAKQSRVAHPGKVLTPKDCLRTRTRAECKAMAEAQKNAGPGQTMTPGNCAQVLGQAHCEALAQAQQH
jgi:hypothetical protein